MRCKKIFPYVIFLVVSSAGNSQSVLLDNASLASMNMVHVADTLPLTCAKDSDIEKIIEEAISLGAPIYNAGLHMACYRIYEWAAYKILYEYGKPCPNVATLLKTAIDKSHGDYSDTEKAWMMRVAFDKILGVPTQTGEGEKETPLRKG